MHGIVAAREGTQKRKALGTAHAMLRHCSSYALLFRLNDFARGGQHDDIAFTCPASSRTNQLLGPGTQDSQCRGVSHLTGKKRKISGHLDGMRHGARRRCAVAWAGVLCCAVSSHASVKTLLVLGTTSQ